jgi:hypothetical protein
MHLNIAARHLARRVFRSGNRGRRARKDSPEDALGRVPLPPLPPGGGARVSPRGFYRLGGGGGVGDAAAGRMLDLLMLTYLYAAPRLHFALHSLPASLPPCPRPCPTRSLWLLGHYAGARSPGAGALPGSPLPSLTCDRGSLDGLLPPHVCFAAFSRRCPSLRDCLPANSRARRFPLFGMRENFTSRAGKSLFRRPYYSSLYLHLLSD